MRKVFLFVSILALTQVANAQLSVGTELRNRGEYRDGYQKLAGEDNEAHVSVSQRTRIIVNFENEDLKLRFSPQDVRVWGDEVNGNNKPSLELFEGWVDFKFLKNSRLVVGRQVWNYDNQFLLSAGNWNQRGTSHDALLYKYKSGEWDFHLGAAWNSASQTLQNNYYRSNRYKSLNLLWLRHKGENGLSASLTHLSSGITESDESNTIRFRHTTGLYSVIEKGDFSAFGNAYYQYGKNKANVDVSAYLLAAGASIKAGDLKTGLAGVYLSGRKKDDTNKDRLFDYIYASGHGNFGDIDYFRSFATDTRGGGLGDIYLYFDYAINEKVNIKNTSHYFTLAQEVNKYNEGGAIIGTIDKNLGFENDIVLKYKFSKSGAFESGYAFFLPTDNLKDIQGITDTKYSHFFYVMLTFTPKIY